MVIWCCGVRGKHDRAAEEFHDQRGPFSSSTGVLRRRAGLTGSFAHQHIDLLCRTTFFGRCGRRDRAGPTNCHQAPPPFRSALRSEYGRCDAVHSARMGSRNCHLAGRRNGGSKDSAHTRLIHSSGLKVTESTGFLAGRFIRRCLSFRE